MLKLHTQIAESCILAKIAVVEPIILMAPLSSNNRSSPLAPNFLFRKIKDLLGRNCSGRAVAAMRHVYNKLVSRARWLDFLYAAAYPELI